MLSLSFAVPSLLVQPTPPPSNAPSASSRRAVVQGAGALLASPLLTSPLAAKAFGGGVDGADVRGVNANRPQGEKECNKLLSNLGKPTFKVPGGFQPLVAYIGTAMPANIDGQKVKDRAFSSTLLVRFLYPSGWLVETPSVTDNGEAGNIGANNYVKGDSANFASLPLKSGSSLSTLDKEYFKTFLSAQMSNDVYEDIKIKKVRIITQDDGTEMARFDFGYSLLTRAGFSVDRKGTAAAMVSNNAVVGLVAATTALRYKELSDSLETMADSFRAYNVKPPELDNLI